VRRCEAGDAIRREKSGAALHAPLAQVLLCLGEEVRMPTQSIVAEALTVAGSNEARADAPLDRQACAPAAGEHVASASSIAVLPARAEDVPRIADIYAYHVRNGLASFETDPPTLREINERRIDLRANGFPFLVAFVRDRVVGYAYAGPYRERRAYRFTVEDSIYIHPSHVGAGIGGVLLDALIHESDLRGFRQMIAVIGDSDNHASINLHARHGFAMIGTLSAVGFKRGRWVDVVLMQRRLGSGDRALP
jgi:phosphinothricin acetyltransferase